MWSSLAGIAGFGGILGQAIGPAVDRNQ